MTTVVYGAASDIGYAVVHGFLEEGKSVVAVDHSEFSDKLRARAEADSRLSLLSCGEVPGSDYDLPALLDRCEQVSNSTLRTLICVAPPVGQVKVLHFTGEDLRQIIDLELVVPALLMQEAGRRMARAGAGQIIIFCSMSAKTGVHTQVAPFAAAKGGLLAYMRVMAAELAPNGVTVNAIATSLFEPQVAILPQEERARLTLGIPARRFGKPREAAAAALYLASANAAFITGETLNLSGGRFMD
ncbi:SDR family NAD(P)-dependent oxidoreductase [Amorphus sp. MBR-141]